MDRRHWVVVALVTVVLLGTGACGGSGGPTAAPSGPGSGSGSGVDDRRMACDKINAARRDFLDAVQRADITFDDPSATPAEIHDQADKIVTALIALDNEAAEAATETSDTLLKKAAWDFAVITDNVLFLVREAGDDPQKINAALHAEWFKKREQRVLDLCLGHYSSPPPERT